MSEQREGESDGSYRKRRWREQQRTLDAEGNVKSIIEVRRGRSPKRAPPVGVPIATSQYLDKEGRVTGEWRKYGPERRDPALVAKVIADELFKPLPRLAPIAFQAYNGQIAAHLTVGYPVGDQHNGMLSWAPETGASWDISISEKMLGDAFQHLIPLTPKCENAFAVFLGDFNHYDSPKPQTPHGTPLDADSRWQKMVRASLRMMRRQIEALALWHRTVQVIIIPGNHDPFLSVVLSEALANIYEHNPRIVIDTSPSPYRYLRFEKNLFGFTHGDTCKPEALQEIMTADRARDWGETEYRTWWTGHIHSRNAKDFRGCSWESFRVLPPADAWAHRMGYRSIRDQKAIVFHAEFGEVARHTVNPSMLEKP